MLAVVQGIYLPSFVVLPAFIEIDSCSGTAWAPNNKFAEACRSEHLGFSTCRHASLLEVVSTVA